MVIYILKNARLKGKAWVRIINPLQHLNALGVMK